MDELHGLRVLLVEDDAASAELTGELLAEALVEPAVVLARTLAEATRLAAGGEVDLALVDLGLPDAEGLEAVSAVRSAAGPSTAVVVLTGRGAGDAAEEALRRGAQDYLIKADLQVADVRRSVRYAVLRNRAEATAHGTVQWAQSVLDSIESPVCALGRSGAIEAVNSAWTRFCVANGGDPALMGVGADYLEVCRRAAQGGDRTAARVEQGLRQVMRGDAERFQLEYPCDAPGESRWFSLRATPGAGLGAVVVTHVDITSLRDAQHELNHLATHDPLTGLGNRRLLLDDLARRLEPSAAGAGVAVLFADLDHFKRINDTHGHAVGDGVLSAVAEHVRDAVRAGDVVVRQGGDEFVVVADVSGEDEALVLADRVQAALSQPVLVDGVSMPVTASQGLVVVEAGSGASPEEVLDAADAAMYQAKDRGRGRIAVYSEELRRRTQEREHLRGELEAALAGDQLELHYQPIVGSARGELHGVEALLRWRHPRLGLLSPDRFLPIAESSGLIVPIGSWAIREACAQGRRLHDAGQRISVAVNLSARQLTHPYLRDDVAEALASSGFDPGSLVLEMTETTMIANDHASLETLTRLKALGLQIAVDDFGTGYSSLSYLRKYPVDGLKIDRSFVRELADSPDDQAIVGSVLALARQLRLWVVAEGVEDERQRRVLLDLGCEWAQGYLHARPTPADELPAVIERLSAREQRVVPLPRGRRRPGTGAPGLAGAGPVLDAAAAVRVAGDRRAAGAGP